MKEIRYFLHRKQNPPYTKDEKTYIKNSPILFERNHSGYPSFSHFLCFGEIHWPLIGFQILSILGGWLVGFEKYLLNGGGDGGDGGNGVGCE